MNPEEICVLIPTRKRPLQLRRVLASLLDTAPTMPCVIIGDPDDTETHKFWMESPVQFIYVQTSAPKQGCVAAWNVGLASYPNASAYILGADDIIFMPGWYGAMIAALDKIGGSGLVGFNDGRKNGNVANSTHYLMTRDFIIQHHGGVMAVPHYTAEMIDLEACERAKKAGKYIWAENAHVYHDWQGGPYGDETYRLAWDRRGDNQKLYEERKAKGFPDDFPSILTNPPLPAEKGKRNARRTKPK